MSTPEVPASKRSHRFRISRWMAVIGGVSIVLVVDPFFFPRVAVACLALDAAPRLDRARPCRLEHAWALPGRGCALGLLWVFGVMFAQIPKLPPVVELDEGEGLFTATARILITHGPFAYSRNPRYLAATVTWFGWAIFYGSVVFLVLTVVGWTLLSYLMVPQEERGLESRFGAAYRDYRRRVPRWIGTIRRE